MKINLPHFLCPEGTVDLVRLGKRHDGGYLVSKADIEKTDTLIGLGISDDWSFEEDFLRARSVRVVAYDASINTAFFLRQIIKSTLRLDKPLLLFRKIMTLVSYWSFFSRKNVSHVQKFVGLDSFDTQHSTLSEVLDHVGGGNIFLKIDIEGSEYRALNDLLVNQKKLTGLVIEFHDCDLHLSVIKKFVTEFGLKLIHIHANNFAPVNRSNMPLVLELTFSRYADSAGTGAASLPHKLDMPNNQSKPEITLSFPPSV